MNAEAAIGRFIGVDNGKLSVAMGEPSLSGIIVDINDDTGLATDITPFRRGGTLSQT
jgi:calcineurin-like phosphoesterase